MDGIVRRMFTGTSSNSNRIVQSQEDLIHDDYMNWSITGENIENIYKIGTFDFKTAFSIKTHE